MSRPDSPEYALRQAAMWRRLADQCRRCGDHDLERDARMLARSHLQLARLQQGKSPMPEKSRQRQESVPAAREGGKRWWAV
jgi:hypothetical protein